MWKFSHWEVEVSNGLWRDREVWHPVYVWEPNVIHIAIEVRREPTAEERARDQIAEYDRQTRVAIALTRKVEAETTLLDSYARLALKKVQVKQLAALAQRADLPALEYDPAIEIDNRRRER